MKFIVLFLVFLLPFHALIITFLKCKVGINTDILRFWKEGIILFLLAFSSFVFLKKHKFSIKKIYTHNYILGLSSLFILSSALFIYIPFFEFKLSGFLGFKYDVFFIFALLIGLFLPDIKNHLNLILKTLFSSIGIMLIIFTPWYIFGDISSISNLVGYSDKVSTYVANSCISFAQNVNGEHRFQASFAGPIRFSVFMVVFYIIYIGYILKNTIHSSKRTLLLVVPSIFVIAGIFYSYSKTSILGLLFSLIMFILLYYKIILNKKISKKIVYAVLGFTTIPLAIIIIFKRDLFLHLGSIINRMENINKSIEMFFYNPIGYGLGIAGPASQIGNSIESAGSWQIATITVTKTHKFLPENWFIQILLEQGIIGLFIFVSLIVVIGKKLYNICVRKKDPLSISIFVAFISLVFMGNFTHSFEESATSYILFLIIGIYLSNSYRKPKK